MEFDDSSFLAFALSSTFLLRCSKMSLVFHLLPNFIKDSLCHKLYLLNILFAIFSLRFCFAKMWSLIRSSLVFLLKANLNRATLSIYSSYNKYLYFSFPEQNFFPATNVIATVQINDTQHTNYALSNSKVCNNTTLNTIQLTAKWPRNCLKLIIGMLKGHHFM